jgi:hypothetical protein
MKNLGLFLLMLGGCVHGLAQSSSQSCDSTRQAQGALVGAFRVLNTAEARFNQSNHRFATVSELVNFDETKKLSADLRYSQPSSGSVAIGPADDLLQGYTVHLIVSADGKSYVITATKKEGACTGVGATTDERGVIYFIEPLR